MTQFNDCLGPRRQAQHTLMIFLVGIALADGNFSSAERTAIFRLSDLLRLPRREVEQLISMVTAQSQFQHGGYRRLGGGDYGAASRGASELETAYEALASKQRLPMPRSSDAIESS